MNTTYNIALYFLGNHTFAAEEDFTVSEAASLDDIYIAAVEHFEDFIVDNRPVYVGSVKQDYKWSR